MTLRISGLLAMLLALVIFVAPPGAAGDDKTEVKPAEKKELTPPYPVDHTRALEAKEEVVNQADDHTQYRVEFTGIKGDRVPGFLYVPKRKPADAKTPCPAILLQYGTGGNKTTNYIVAVGKQFVSKGYVVLTIDSPGCGERKKGEKKAAVVLGIVNPEQVFHYCGDYSRAVDFLCSRPEVDKERLGYVGISWGAITGITYVAYDPRIKAVGSMVGGGNFLGTYSAKAAEKAASEVSKSSDPVFHVARIAPRPLLFINVTKDQMIAKPWAESLHKAAGPNSKVVWLEADHTFKGADRTKVCDSVIEFMDKSMPASRPTGGK